MDLFLLQGPDPSRFDGRAGQVSLVGGRALLCSSMLDSSR